MDTGIVYPTLKLGGVAYAVKFTRGGLVYKMSKDAVSLADLRTPSKSFGALVDILFGTLENYSGTKEELANLLLNEEQVRAATQAVYDAVGKVFPSQAAAAAAENEPASPLKQ